MKPFDILVINEDIKGTTLPRVQAAINNRQTDRLFLVLETFGGLPGIAYRIMKLLDAKYKTIDIVVPNIAMSAGTLMSFGGDRIHMFSSSSLGPLDLQIEHPTDGSRISTLDVRDTMNTILSHTIISAGQLFGQAYNEFDLNREIASKFALDSATKLVQPIVDKIDPYHLHRSFRNGEVGATYASNLLKTRMMSANYGLADAVGKFLNNNYSTHNYNITLDEARDTLSLTVNDLEELKEWPKINSHINLSVNGVYYYSVEAETPKEAKAPKVTKATKETKEEQKQL